MEEIEPIYTTTEQSRWLKDKDYNVKIVRGGYLKPEQWQVVEWLRVNHGIWISVNIALNMKTFSAYVIHKSKGGYDTEEFNSPQEAYSAAFDYIRNNKLI